MIKKGCLTIVAAWIAVFAGYYVVLRSRVEPPGDIFLALFGSIGLFMLVSAVWQVVFGKGDQAALRRAAKGLPLLDGEKEAVWGTIVPTGSPLSAPFSGRACVGYEYDVKKAPNPQDEGPTGSEASGWALAPSIIRSSRGDVRLLGFGLLDEFPASHQEREPLARDRAAEFLSTTRFEQMGLSQIGKMISEMDRALESEQGSSRRDWKMAKGEIAVGDNLLIEKLVGIGDTVTAVGVYDASQGALVPKYKGRTAPINLMPGGGEAMVIKESQRPWALLAFSVIWSGFAHVFIYVALTAAKGR